MKKSRPKVRKGQKLGVFEWRDGQTKTVTATTKRMQDEDMGVYEVGILFENGDEHYAQWIEERQRWETGDL